MPEIKNNSNNDIMNNMNLNPDVLHINNNPVLDNANESNQQVVNLANIANIAANNNEANNENMPNNAMNAHNDANNMMNVNNNNNNYNSSISSSDLHEAILANSQSVVELLLEQGANPNRSPQLAPVGVIAASSSERARDLHRSLGRVFRSRQGGTIHPLHVAVCNAYHHCVFGRTEAIGIVQALLKAGADRKSTCSGIAFCKVGTHPTVTIASSKTCDKVALFLKRFPLVSHAVECCSMMDEVATLILQIDPDAQALINNNQDGIFGSPYHNNGPQHHYRQDSFSNFPTNTTTTTPVICSHTLETWNKLLDDSSFTDLVFQCPDGQVGAHKSILIAAVPYFATALQGPWREGNMAHETTAAIGSDDEGDGDDVTGHKRNKSTNFLDLSNNGDKQVWKTSNSVATMKVVLQFIYTGQVEMQHKINSSNNVSNNSSDTTDASDDGSTTAIDIPTILSVATEYQLQVLQDHYEQELIKSLSVDTLASTLQLSHLHHLVKLQEKCHDFCHEHATTVLVHPDMLGLSTQPNDVWNDLVEGLATRNETNKKRKREVLWRNVHKTAQHVLPHQIDIFMNKPNKQLAWN